MTTVATTSMDALTWLRKQLDVADNDLVRQMLQAFAERS